MKLAANTQNGVDVTAASLKEHCPEVAAALVAEGRAQSADEARAEGARLERERILGIEALAFKGEENLVAEMKKDGKTTPEQAAVALRTAEKQRRDAQLGSLRKDGEETAGISAGGSATGDRSTIDANAPIEERAKAEWQASADLQKEHADVNNYIALRKREQGRKLRRVS